MNRFQTVGKIRLALEELVTLNRERNKLLKDILDVLKTEAPDIVGIIANPGEPTPRP